MFNLSTVSALVLATLLSAHGIRKKSLSPSGALAAFVVGFLMMSGGTRAFGVPLIGFYLAGSRATKYGKARKAKLEDGYQEGGYRSATQVLCNSASALVACVAWNALFAPQSAHAAFAGALVTRILPLRVKTSDLLSLCAISPSLGEGWSRALILAGLGHFACCLGDTLASELGILSKGKPRLITTLKHVPPGTNGAMSIGGTVASIAGGAFVGALTGVTLLVENRSCAVGILGECVSLGALFGGLGSLIDSFLGATVQQTRYSTEKKLVLQDGNKEGTVISGLNFLTNNQINLVSSIACAVMGLLA
ncbi:hypothetical protein D9619_008843 [Psilocybe cf. subviscida]|uniref:Integral membrane protein DUF92-domain-containing protein n=1 Tax=Psilocybe cf. subviscida TaxID=2480587 RepID=A0A8H5BAN7_9AGAR|nr:hypothetical protein D9619_008843 [Psilocybe cf. subviscida]